MPNDHQDGNLVDASETRHNESVFPAMLEELPVTGDTHRNLGVVFPSVEGVAHDRLSTVAVGRDAIPDLIELLTTVIHLFR